MPAIFLRPLDFLSMLGRRYMAENTDIAVKDSVFKDGCRVAAGMMVHDRLFLPGLYALIVLPRCLATAFLAPTSDWLLYVRVLERMVWLVGLWVLGRRWVSQLSSAKPKSAGLNVIIFLALGIALWLTHTIPVSAVFYDLPNELKLVLLLALIPALHLNLQYYFFFFPAVLGIKPLSNIIYHSLAIARHERWLVLRAVVGPAGLYFLLNSIAQGFSPDGRSLAISILTDTTSGIFWLWTSYFGLALGFMILPDAMWREFELDPYRKSRLATIALRGPAWLSASFFPNKGLIMLLLGCLVWAGNLMRLADLPPGPELRLTAVSVDGSKVLLDVHAEDPDYKFRGFYPIFFNIAGENHTPLANRPSAATLASSGEAIDFALSGQLSAADIKLVFDTPRQAQELAALQDVWLWYRNTKIAKLAFK